MEWLMENWYVCVAMLCVGAFAGAKLYVVYKLPNSEKMKWFKTMLCGFVEKAEYELNLPSGKEKLAYVYNEMLKNFPFITLFMSKETFEMLVNGALYEVGIWLKADNKKVGATMDTNTFMGMLIVALVMLVGFYISIKNEIIKSEEKRSKPINELNINITQLNGSILALNKAIEKLEERVGNHGKELEDLRGKLIALKGEVEALKEYLKDN